MIFGAQPRFEIFSISTLFIGCPSGLVSSHIIRPSYPVLSAIKLANSLNLPMFLHQRDAHKEFMICLSTETPKINCVVHCFTGNKKELFEYLDKNFYIGLTGWVCDPKRGAHLEELIPLIPLNRLLIETDSPYLLPKNLKVKGRRNEPSFLIEILKKIIKERSESENEIIEMLSKNSFCFFNIQQ